MIGTSFLESVVVEVIHHGSISNKLSKWLQSRQLFPTQIKSEILKTKGLGTKPGIFIGLDSTINAGAFKVFKHPSDIGA